MIITSRHVRPVYRRHFLLHDHRRSVFCHDLLMGVNVIMPVFSSRVDTIILVVGLGQMSLIESHHIRVNLVDICRVSKVHHVGRISSRRAHVYFKAGIFALLSKTLAGFGQAEELQMDETAVDAELLRSPAADLAEFFRYVGIRVVLQIKVVVYDLHDRSGPCGHILKQRLEL